MYMSKPLDRRAAANAFAAGIEHIRTQSSLTFEGDIAYSYSEPIAVRVNGVVFCTDATFSMTTAHHIGHVRGAAAVRGNLELVHHRVIRELARERGGYLGNWGRRFDGPGRPAADVVSARLEVAA
jgi:hypothetical protein